MWKIGTIQTTFDFVKVNGPSIFANYLTVFTMQKSIFSSIVDQKDAKIISLSVGVDSVSS